MLDLIGLMCGRKRKPQPRCARRHARRPDRHGQITVRFQHSRRVQRRCASPRITGTIALWAGSRPSARVKRRAFCSGLHRSAPSPFNIRSAAAAAATDAGGNPVENISVRARFSRNAITSDRAQT